MSWKSWKSWYRKYRAKRYLKRIALNREHKKRRDELYTLLGILLVSALVLLLAYCKFLPSSCT